MCKILIGIDGGGTHTRVAVSDQNLNLLNYINFKGSCVPAKSAQALENMQNAVKLALGKNHTIDDVIGFCIGMAGVDFDEDLMWAHEVIAQLSLKCKPIILNDCIPAHHGAFWQKDCENKCKIVSDKIIRGNGLYTCPGIVAVAGTGAITTGINDDGKILTNYDFHHFGGPRARDLAYYAVWKLVAGEFDQSDKDFKDKILKHFSVASVEELSKLGATGFILDQKLRDNFFGDLAPSVTSSAKCGSNTAKFICNSFVDELIIGMNLVASGFASQKIPTVLVGSVLQEEYIKKIIIEKLKPSRFIVKEPICDPCMGALKIAAEQ